MIFWAVVADIHLNTVLPRACLKFGHGSYMYNVLGGTMKPDIVDFQISVYIGYVDIHAITYISAAFDSNPQVFDACYKSEHLIFRWCSIEKLLYKTAKWRNELRASSIFAKQGSCWTA